MLCQELDIYIYIYDALDNRYGFPISVQPEIDCTTFHSFFSWNVWKEKTMLFGIFKDWQVCDWLAKWIIMLGFMDVGWPRVFRRSNVGLVLFLFLFLFIFFSSSFSFSSLSLPPSLFPLSPPLPPSISPFLLFFLYIQHFTTLLKPIVAPFIEENRGLQVLLSSDGSADDERVGMRIDMCLYMNNSSEFVFIFMLYNTSDTESVDVFHRLCFKVSSKHNEVCTNWLTSHIRYFQIDYKKKCILI